MTDKLATASITDLLTEINDFDPEIFPPVEEYCAEHSDLLGDCPVELRRFYSFSRHCERELKQLKVEIQFTKDEDNAIGYRIGQLTKKHQVCQVLMFYALREFFGEYEDGRSIDVAAGWKVIAFTPVIHPECAE